MSILSSSKVGIGENPLEEWFVLKNGFEPVETEDELSKQYGIDFICKSSKSIALANAYNFMSSPFVKDKLEYWELNPGFKDFRDKIINEQKHIFKYYGFERKPADDISYIVLIRYDTEINQLYYSEDLPIWDMDFVQWKIFSACLIKTNNDFKKFVKRNRLYL